PNGYQPLLGHSRSGRRTWWSTRCLRGWCRGSATSSNPPPALDRRRAGPVRSPAGGPAPMQFGIFYEHQLPRPWQEDSEARLIREALAQVELADRLGIDFAWEVEHHFLEEYSHSSAPEVFLAACAARTERIRLGHGIVLMPPGYNHPARV